MCGGGAGVLPPPLGQAAAPACPSHPFPSEGKQGDAEGEAGDGGRYYHQPEAVEIKPDPLVDSLLYSLTQTPAGDYDGPVPSSPEYRGPTSPLRTTAKGWRPDSPPKRAAAPVPVALAVLRMDQTQTASDGAGIKLLEPPTPLLFDSDATFGFAMRRVGVKVTVWTVLP